MHQENQAIRSFTFFKCLSELRIVFSVTVLDNNIYHQDAISKERLFLCHHCLLP